MKQCKNCIFYDVEFDLLHQSGDDCVIIGNEKEYHHCGMYDDTLIPTEVSEDVKECEYFSQKVTSEG